MLPKEIRASPSCALVLETLASPRSPQYRLSCSVLPAPNRVLDCWYDGGQAVRHSGHSSDYSDTVLVRRPPLVSNSIMNVFIHSELHAGMVLRYW